ncbi:hypothetical protein [Truepera radiovictrix]|uniref:hypothetical protein n=1 Tax=Truepera radiovictrix TaxID=332249 RepID=UPI0002F74AB2|nr:hypothetical protein [Truepera radiovictrix]WMT57966.1 hypothetical protein RCV51_03205 [Truepera radiovictrix]
MPTLEAGVESAGTVYRCPKCKRDVTVLLARASVSCSRCGRAMRRVADARPS